MGMFSDDPSSLHAMAPLRDDIVELVWLTIPSSLPFG